jgi:hypothetical protein
MEHQGFKDDMIKGFLKVQVYGILPQIMPEINLSSNNLNNIYQELMKIKHYEAI